MSCELPVSDKSVVAGRMQTFAMQNRIPMQVTVEIIATCNFDCKHCYIAPGAARDDIMSLERAELLFDRLVEAGTFEVLLTGGEVLSHRDFRAIYLAARRRGLLIYINTNGYLIGERWADFFAEFRPMNLSISLYGLSDKRYEDVTGIPNAFRRIERALDLLDARQVKYSLKCPAFTLTSDEIPGMREYATARGVRFAYDSSIQPHEKGGLDSVKMQLSPDQVMALDNRMDPGLEREGEFFTSRLRPNNGRVYKCGAGKIGFHVNVRGDVSTCVTSRQSVGNIFENGYEFIWAALGNKVERRFPEGHPCGTCNFRGVCFGCPASVEALTGLPEGYVQQYCKITHQRAHQLGVHATGIPRTVVEGIPAFVRVPSSAVRRALPVL